LGKFWRVLHWKMLVYVFYGDFVYFTAVWYILRPFVVKHLVCQTFGLSNIWCFKILVFGLFLVKWRSKFWHSATWNLEKK
jgi:hypothetical protein